MDPITSAPAQQPAATDTPASATPPASTHQPIGITSDQLRERLLEERAKGARDLIASLGFASTDEAKAAYERLRAVEEASKTEDQKLREKLAALEPKAKRADDLEAWLAEQARITVMALPEADKALVLELAGSDPEKQIKVANRLRETGKIGATSTQAAPSVRLPPPSTTAPINQAPPPANVTTVDHLQVFQHLQSTNEYQARLYYLRHAGVIDAARKNQT